MSATGHDRSRWARFAFVTDRPVAISMFVVAMAVFGGVSFSKLSLDLLPEVSYPTLTVRTTWPGAAPEDVEERISEKVQESLSTLDDLVRATSVSRAGVSDVVLDFDWGTQMTFAVQDVREKLDGVFLPDGVERPLILRYDPNLDPVLRIGMRAPEGREASTPAERIEQLVQLRWLAENRIKRDLEAIEGVAAVQVRGGLEEEIRVRVDPYRLAAKGIDPADVATRLAQENINASGGSVLEGSTEYLVRTVNEFRDIEEILQLPLTQRNDAVIRVRDVGTVERTHEKREVITRIGGAEAVELAIYREAGANIVVLAKRLETALLGTPEQREIAARIESEGRRPNHGELQQVDFIGFRLRDEARLEVLSDQSTFIEDAVNDVRESAVLGGFLAVLVILVFLRSLPATFIIGLSIPISIIVTFAFMFMADVSLNIMSLGGLALGVGMLVDNAIVVLESIMRCREEGDDLATAALRGTAEVAGAVASCTLTTVVVFAPIVFVQGIAGQIFGDQALTVVSSLMISMVVALLFIPTLAARRVFAGVGSREPDLPVRAPSKPWAGLNWNWERTVSNVLTVLGRALLWLGGLLVLIGAALLKLAYRAVALLLKPFALAFALVWNAIERGYPGAVGVAIRHPILVVAAAALLLWAAIERIPALGVELLPEIHQGEFTAHATLFVGSPLENTDAVLRELEARVCQIPGVANTALTVGVEKETLTREIEGSHTGRLTVRLTPEARTPVREEQIAQEVRTVLGDHPAMRGIEITRPNPFAIEAPIAVEVKGYDLEEIEGVAAEVERRMRTIEGLADVRTSVRPGHPEARVTFDREKMLELGLDLATVSTLVRDQVLGNVSTRFQEGDDRIAVRVIGDEVILSTIEAVLELPVNPSAETPVPLRSVAEIDIVQGPAEIRRIDNTRAVVVSAASAGLDLGGLSDRIEQVLASVEHSDEVRIDLGGQMREMRDARANMTWALLLAIFLVYVVMAMQFESLLQPFVVLLTVPLEIVGVVFALDWLGISISVIVFIGLILLAGIVVDNAIVLVDRINQQRRAGMGLYEAVVEAGGTRLRPIMMTTVTTVLGLLPMTGWLAGLPLIGDLGAGEGAEIRAPMAVTVIAGLTSSTILTLFVIPTVYCVFCRRALRTAESG